MSGRDDSSRPRTDSLFIGGAPEVPAQPAVPARSTSPSGRLSPRPPSGQPATANRPTPRRVTSTNGEPGVARNDSARLITIIAVVVGVLGLLSLVLLLTNRRTVVIPSAPTATPATASDSTTATNSGSTSNSRLTPPAPGVVVVPPRASTSPVPSKGTLNLVPNPSIEDLVDGKPPNWKTPIYSGSATFTVSDVAHRGNHSLCISSQDGADVGWALDIPVKPRTTYLFKGWIRTENVAGNAKGAMFYLLGTDFSSQNFTGTTDWKLASFQFDSGDRTSVQLNCLYGGWGRSTGTAWYDDFELIELFSSK